MTASSPLIRYILTAAFRDRIMIALLIMIGLGGCLSIFLGSSAVNEKATFATVFAGGGLRFLGTISLILFVCFYIRRAFDHKEVEFMLSRPIGRLGYLLSHAASFTILAVLIGAILTSVMALLGQPNIGGLLLWGASITIELIIMGNIALFFSMVLSSAAGSALACLGFYVLARMMGTLLGIANEPSDFLWINLLSKTMNVIAILVPRFDMMGQTSWLVYGAGGVDGANSLEFAKNTPEMAKTILNHIGVFGYILMQGIVFTGLTISAAYHDLTRRQF